MSKDKLPADVTLFVIQQNGPQPFGLTLGKSEIGETKTIITREGGKWIGNERKQPGTFQAKVFGLPIEHLEQTQLWFYEGTLFSVNYLFKVSLDKRQFNDLLAKLKTKYGCPIKYIGPNYQEASMAFWRFDDVEVEITAPRVSEMMCLEYRHVPKAQEAMKEEAYYSFSSQQRTVKTNEKGL